MKKITKKQLLLDHIEKIGGKISWHDAVNFLLQTKNMTLNIYDSSRGHYSSYFSDSVSAPALMSYPSKDDNRYLVKIDNMWCLQYADENFIKPSPIHWSLQYRF